MGVLSALHWELSAPTSHTFLHQLIAKLRSLNMLTGSQVSQLERHARTLATLAATEHANLVATLSWFCSSPPSFNAPKRCFSAQQPPSTHLWTLQDRRSLCRRRVARRCPTPVCPGRAKEAEHRPTAI